MEHITSEQIENWLNADMPDWANDYKDSFQLGKMRAVVWAMVNELTTPAEYADRIKAAQPKPKEPAVAVPEGSAA